MDEIKRQIRRAQRRLVMHQLIEALTWSLLGAFSVALVAIILRKIWPLAVDGDTWRNAWIVGATVLGLAAGLLWTFIRRRSALDAAIEIDRRCGLKERVSSAMSISTDESQSEAGQALLKDAQRHLSRVDIKEHFRDQIHWHALLPVVVAIAVFLVAFLIGDASTDKATASPNTERAREQVRKSIQDLKKRLEEQKRKAEANGLKKADAIFSDFKKAVDELSKNSTSRKKVLVKLNNLSKEVATRKQNLESSRKMRRQLQQLKKIQQGPADRIANALKSGDMNRALKELKKLQDKLRAGDLSAKEKQDLIKQLDQLRKQIEQSLGAKQELEKKKRDLQSRINDLKKKGDPAAAGRLQKKLDQVQKQLDDLNQREAQLGRLGQLAKKLGECAECMKSGDLEKAGDKLGQLAKDLEKMQSELDALETLDQMMEEIACTKNAMNCQKCSGEGCSECQGSMQMPGGKKGKGDGSGEGFGDGERPEERTETGGYRTRVGAKPRPGKALRVGDARGRNLAGQSQQVVQEEIASSFSEDPDPVTHQNLPRREREQTKEYFETLRKGE